MMQYCSLNTVDIFIANFKYTTCCVLCLYSTSLYGVSFYMMKITLLFISHLSLLLLVGMSLLPHQSSQDEEGEETFGGASPKGSGEHKACDAHQGRADE